MDKEHKESFRVLFNEWFKQDQRAIEYCAMIVEVVSLWDDLVDGDSRTEEEINLVFRLLMFDIPMNSFFAAHKHILCPIHLCFYRAWADANTMERSPRSAADLEKTFMLRAQLYDLFVIVAFLIGGDEWAQAIGPSIRRTYAERLNSYIEEKS
jgi:hypothetical protein